MRPRVSLVLGIVALIVAACGGSSPGVTAKSATPAATPAPTVGFVRTPLSFTVGSASTTLDVEVATTGAQSERGLGYRDALPPDAGMIFDLRDVRIPQFWMKGMRFPLDMVWIGEDKRVAEITRDIAPQPGVPDGELRLYAPKTPVRYTLELNAGAAARLGIDTGTQLSFELP